MKIIAATNNNHKLTEIRAILAQMDIQTLSMKDIGLDIEVEENGQTFIENALIKARAISKITGEMAMADDSGLQVEALGGEPGIYSARFSGATGEDKDRQNNAKLKQKMQDIPPQKRNARFCCAIAAVFPDGREITAEGFVYGKIGYEEKGSNGFGYDPLFIVDGYNGKSMAELDPSIKNQISHRANALKDFATKLKAVLPQN